MPGCPEISFLSAQWLEEKIFTGWQEQTSLGQIIFSYAHVVKSLKRRRICRVTKENRKVNPHGITLLIFCWTCAMSWIHCSSWPDVFLFPFFCWRLADQWIEAHGCTSNGEATDVSCVSCLSVASPYAYVHPISCLAVTFLSQQINS